jgi:formate hydrogenlyase subunit 6/NADH:ubiquinone oxidoreductase subunit I
MIRAKQSGFKAYIVGIKSGLGSAIKGMRLTLSQIQKAAAQPQNNQNIAEGEYFEQRKGLETLEYPYEQIPVPDNGRYRLHNEIDDCIVCDKCAKICPVNCIDIATIKSPEEIGKTSDGSSKRLYAERFDIDMAKCCYCGLCTTVCPTECLTMTKVYDFSEVDVAKMTYHFTDLSPEQADTKRKEYDIYVAKKAEEKAALQSLNKTSEIKEEQKPGSVKKPSPVMRPKGTISSAAEQPSSPVSPIEPDAPNNSTKSPTEAPVSNKPLPPWLRKNNPPA